MQSPPARTQPARETREWFAYLPPSALYTRRDVPLAGQETAAQLRLAATHRYPLRKISIIPGIFEIHRSGRSHQISRASATAASAPPYWLPSLSRNFISSISSSRGIPSSAPTRESCSGASAIPRRSSIGAIHRAVRVQNWHSASKNSHPRACRPFPSVYSLTSEIMFLLFLTSLRATALSAPLHYFLLFSVLSVSSVISVLDLFRFFRTFQLSTSSRLFPQQRNHFPPQLHHALQRARRHADDFLEQPRHRRQKFQHALQPFPRVRIALRVGLNLAHALRQHVQRRVDLPPLSLLRTDPENLPHIFNRLKMVAPVPQHVYHAHDPPPLQLAQAGAHVRARHRQRRGNLIRRQRLRRQEQQRMHLRYGAINPPPGAHLSPVQNELLRHRR